MFFLFVVLMEAFFVVTHTPRRQKYLFRTEEKDMKNNKALKFGISLISVVALGAVAPALTNNPVFGISIVKAEEQQEPLKFRITYYDIETREMLGQMTGVISPGQTINIYKKFNGHEIVSKDEWMPNYILTWDIVNEFFYGSHDGYNDLRLEYKKVENPAPTPDPGKQPDQGQQGQQPEKQDPAKPGQDQGQKPDQQDPAKPGQDQGQKPDQAPGKQLPNTGEKGSTFKTLLGLLTTALAWFVLRKKS